MAKQEWFGPHLLVAHDDGALSLSLVLDGNRCVSVVYVDQTKRFPFTTPRTVVAVQSNDPATELRLQQIDGPGTFAEGVKFAITLVLLLELLADHEVDQFTDQFPSGEMFPDNIAAREIASARAALMTVRATNDVRRAG